MSEAELMTIVTVEGAGHETRDGIAPASPEATAILERIVGPERSADDRRALREELERYTDGRVERYWQLLGILNDRPPFEPIVPAYQWLIDALRATESEF